MNELKTEDISALLELLKDSGFDEFHVETDEFEVYIVRRGVASRKLGPASVASGSSVAPAPALPQAAASSPATARASERTGPTAAGGAARTAVDTRPIPAPLMGNFFRAPSPGAAPFVEVGQEVTAETTIGIIEVMKLMNQIPAGVSGVIEEILVEDGTLVEFGQAIMLVSSRAE